MSKADEIHRQLRALDAERRASNAQFLARAAELRQELALEASATPESGEAEPPAATEASAAEPPPESSIGIYKRPAPEPVDITPDVVDVTPEGAIGFHPNLSHSAAPTGGDETPTNQPVGNRR